LDTGVHLHIVGHNHDENEVGGYIDHHMKTMLNYAFRYEENSPMNGHNVQAEAFIACCNRHNNLYMKAALPIASFLLQ